MRARLREDRFDNLGFAPDIVLPPQVNGRGTTGTRRLMAAVLEAALHDLTHPLQQIREHARAWFHSYEREWPMSFLAICEELRISPDYIRRRLPTTIRPHRPRYGSTLSHCSPPRSLRLSVSSSVG